MMSHAFLNAYDVAVRIAGDGDYVPLVAELKRLRKVVYVGFFTSSGLNPELRIASDTFFPLDDALVQDWTTLKREDILGRVDKPEGPIAQ
jgi:uncharacterized LabA/DUF88 family protein